ncbi:imidazole glycerol phosphate synthase subunit HisH [Litorilituus sediminis]|uniref:Imidazole glycerol phosphate synthase subunit HisH n=1 Tax=Litorilituus sediminis TaxID=718192 RepID=A0A4P6P391_9GAMM|nr:imidazole glycerol phosphate synthase subunit HisH [Litorilituus sediminis]QBG35218.1 imidazole glycerol phosphate synthase subunit HisH [Litorilituus sediminis]
MIGILNIGLGNVQSVYNAVYENGYDPIFVSKPEELEQLTHFIMPGVGNFSAVMHSLEQLKLVPAIQALIARGVPTLGICLGMQLLATSGEEGGLCKGFDAIAAKVKAIPNSNNLRVPHVGWNEVKFTQEHPVFADIKDTRDFYFVHSYHMECLSGDNIIATTDYGSDLVCVAGNKNVIGVQFHPEKSQKNGMQLLENFCEWDGEFHA